MSSAVPQRIQCSRQKEWVLPENCIYVGRPTKWGNPFKVGPDLTDSQAVKRFEDYLASMAEEERTVLLTPLEGKHLACWCKLDAPCHADVLLKWANRLVESEVVRLPLVKDLTKGLKRGIEALARDIQKPS